MLYLMHLTGTDGAIFRGEGTGTWDVKVVLTMSEWIKQGRPTWVDLNIGRD